MRALVTGATGFVGRALVKVLQDRGDEVHSLVRNASRRDVGPLAHRSVIHEDRGDFSSIAHAVEASRPDSIHHLAASFSSELDPAPLVEANITYAARLCEAAASLGTPTSIVLASSFWEYASSGEYRPNTLYAATKRAARDLAAWYAAHRGLRVAALVLYDIYGPDDPRPKLIPAMIDAAARGATLSTTGGEQRLDLVHVLDVARAFIAAAEAMRSSPASGRVHEWAVAGGCRVTVRELHALLESARGVRIPVQWGARPYPVHQIFEPVSNIEPLPGWAPSITLKEGLRQPDTVARGRRAGE